MSNVKKLIIRVPLNAWSELCKDISFRTVNATKEEVEKSIVKQLEEAVLSFMENKEEILDRFEKLKRKNAYVT